MKTDEYTQTDEVSVVIQKMKFAAKYVKANKPDAGNMEKILLSTKEAIQPLDFFSFTLSDRVFQMSRKGDGYQLSVEQNGRTVPVIQGPYETVFLKLTTMI